MSVVRDASVIAVETGRATICRFASSILLFINLKLKGLKKVGETRTGIGVGETYGLLGSGIEIGF